MLWWVIRFFFLWQEKIHANISEWETNSLQTVVSKVNSYFILLPSTFCINGRQSRAQGIQILETQLPAIQKLSKILTPIFYTKWFSIPLEFTTAKSPSNIIFSVCVFFSTFNNLLNSKRLPNRNEPAREMLDSSDEKTPWASCPSTD